MQYLLLLLSIACAASFWLGVPGLLFLRSNKTSLSWWFVAGAALAVGWIVANGSVLIQHLAVDESRRQEKLCFLNPPPVEPITVINENGVRELTIENPCGIGEFWVEGYKPIEGLLYGPLYLACCALPYWLIVARRSAPGLTRQIFWLAAAACLIEWAAIIGYLASGGRFGFTFELDLLDLPPLTLPVGFLVAWLVVTQIIWRFNPARAPKQDEPER